MYILETILLNGNLVDIYKIQARSNSKRNLFIVLCIPVHLDLVSLRCLFKVN